MNTGKVTKSKLKGRSNHLTGQNMIKIIKYFIPAETFQGKDGQRTRDAIGELCRTEGEECWKTRGVGHQRARLEPGEAELEH